MSAAPKLAGSQFEQVIEALTARYGPRSHGRWPCPAHDGEDDNLAVDEADDGRALTTCHSRGCTFEQVREALGLGRIQAPSRSKPARELEPQKRAKAPERGRLDQFARRRAKSGGVTVYPYPKPDGSPFFAVLRIEPAGERKRFEPLHHVEGDTFEAGKPDGLLPIYRAPEVEAADPMAVVAVGEGEKVADRLREYGYIATTSSGGSSAAAGTDWSPLAGRHVVIFPDNDEPGRACAAKVAQLLHAIGAASVRIANVPVEGEGDDVADWLDEREARVEDEDDCEAVNADLEGLFNEARLVEAEGDDDVDSSPETSESPIVTKWGEPFDLNARPAPRRYLLRHPTCDGKPAAPGCGDGLLVRGKTGQLVAGGGSGKTMAFCQLVASVALGLPWLGHFHVDDADGQILLALGEETREEAHRRLWQACEAMGLDGAARRAVEARVTLIALAGHPVPFLERGDKGRLVETEHLRQLRQMLHNKAGADGWSLIVLDPLMRFAGPGTDKDNDAATRTVQAFETLVEVPGNPAVILAHHSSKDAVKNGGADSRGATGLTDGFRWEASLVGRGGNVTFELRKSNYTRPMPEPLPLIRGEGGILMVGEVITREDAERVRDDDAHRKANDLARKAVAAFRKLGVESASASQIAGRMTCRRSDGLIAVKDAAGFGWFQNAGTDARPSYVLTDSAPETAA